MPFVRPTERDLAGLRVMLRPFRADDRARGVELLYVLVEPSNDGMLALARRLGFAVEHVLGGTTVVVSLDLQPRQSPSSRRPRTQTPYDAVPAV